MSQTAYKQGMLAWEWPTNYVIIYIYIYGHAFLLKIRLCQVLALQLKWESIVIQSTGQKHNIFPAMSEMS